MTTRTTFALVASFCVAGLVAASVRPVAAQTPVVVDRVIVNRYAPSVRLHRYDRHRPQAIETFLNSCVLKRSDGTVLKGSPLTTADLKNPAYNQDGNYLHPTWTIPSAPNDNPTGDGPATVSSNNAYWFTPFYVKCFDFPNYVDIKYAFWYPFNGFQTFRADIVVTKYKWGWLPYPGREDVNFTWGNFARHVGDWEHVTVRLNKSLTQVLGVWYSQHGDSVYIPYGDSRLRFTGGTHPIVYSALNSHASYPTSDYFQLDRDILPPPGILPVTRLRAVDTCDFNATTVYNTPSPLYSNLFWEPYNTDSIVMVDLNPSANDAMQFVGKWGPLLNNSSIQSPPSLPSSAHNLLQTGAVIANVFGILPSKYLENNGPDTPSHQGNTWWLSDEP